MLAATPTQDSGAPTELLSQLAKGRAAGARFACRAEAGNPGPIGSLHGTRGILGAKLSRPASCISSAWVR